MADNVVANPGVGGATFATDDDGTAQHPYCKIEFGDDNTQTKVSAANPLPVVQTGAIPAGANAIGKLAANSGVIIGDVNVVSAIPGTGATNLGKAEDSGHTTGDVGVMLLAVRNDAGAVLANADLDYVPLATDSTGALRVDLNGTVSTNNSSTATLGANAVFTGTSDDCLNYNEIRITVIASHASATDGLSIQQSTDNSNWDVTDTYTIPATTGKTYSVPRQARYFRIVYTNGSTIQTSFRLQTILNRLGARVSSQRPNDAYSNETDLEQTQSFLMGYNGTTWDRLRSTTANGLAVDATRLIAALPAGTNNIGGVTPQPLSTGGLTYKSFVSANSNNKTSVGAACRVYFISIQNISAAPIYLKMFDKTSGNVTAGTTACDYQFMCPANSTAANGAGIVLNFDPGIGMVNDLTYLLTTGIGTTDNTSVAANIAVVTIGYK